MVELGIERVRDHTCDRCLPASWRSPEEDRWDTASLDEFTYRFSWPDQM